jgi:hypothetical protein
MVNFIPDEEKAAGPHIPFFEDITAKQIPGCHVEKSIETLQSEIRAVLKRLDCGEVSFQSGKTNDPPLRYGYQIHFLYMKHPGRVDCVALPIRDETPKRKDRALAQALWLVRNALEAQLYSQYYQPGHMTILPYLINEQGETIMQQVAIKAVLAPMLSDGR